jgi:hypothetical protein
LPRAAAIGQVMIPVDLVVATPEDLADPAANRSALKRVAAHLSDAMAQQLGRVEPAGPPRRTHLPALGDGIVIARYRGRLRRCGGDPADPRLAVPDGLLPTILAWAWLRRAFF